MTDMFKKFSTAFSKAASKEKKFTAQHEKQLDVLQKFVDEVNAEGVFSAKLQGILQNAIPVLVIKRKKDGLGQTFFIDYGHEPFGGSVTMKLSVNASNPPFPGKEEGYDLRNNGDRDALFEAVGKELARKIAVQETGEMSVHYINKKRNPGA